MKKIAIIGGTGLENPKILNNAREITVETPYGDTSSPLITGTIENKEVVIVSRHGKKHTIPPSAVNNRANIWALKNAGCTHIIATTACGSLREAIDRGHLIAPDQFIDFTRKRPCTFFDVFEPGQLNHAPMADPFDTQLRNLIVEGAKELGIVMHPKGTVVTIEGPRFSTRAESHMFRAWGADIINMSTAPEAILANEIKLPYAAIAMSTDYDCWKEGEAPVTWEDVLKIFKLNVDNVIRLMRWVIDKV
jgi:5'-methylthioadenosine phosphorylase